MLIVGVKPNNKTNIYEFLLQDMFIEKMHNNLLLKKKEKAIKALTEQLENIGLSKNFEVKYVEHSQFSFMDKRNNQKYIFSGVDLLRNWKIHLNLRDENLKVSKDSDCIFTYMPTVIFYLNKQLFSFEVDLNLGEEIYFDNIKIYFKGKLEHIIEWKLFDIQKEDSKRLSKRWHKSIKPYAEMIYLQTIANDFVISKVKRDTYNFYWLNTKKEYASTKEFVCIKKTIKYSNIKNIYKYGIEFIDEVDWEHKFFLSNGEILNLSDFEVNEGEIKSIIPLIKWKLYALNTNNWKRVFYKCKETNRNLPLRNVSNQDELSHLLAKSQNISENLFFCNYEMIKFTNEQPSIYANSNLSQYLNNNTSNDLSPYFDFCIVPRKVSEKSKFFSFLLYLEDEEVKLLDWLFCLIQKEDDYSWFYRVSKSDNGSFMFDVVKVEDNGRIIETHNLHSIDILDIFNNVAFLDFAKERKKLFIVSPVVKVEGNIRTYIIKGWEFKEIFSPFQFDKIIHFSQNIFAQDLNNKSYFFHPKKEIWIEIPHLNISSTSSLSLKQIYSYVKSDWLPAFHPPFKTTCKCFWQTVDYYSDQETFVIDSEQHWTIYYMKEWEKNCINSNINKFYPINAWNSIFEWIKIPQALANHSVHTEHFVIPMIDWKKLANKRWKTLPL